MNELQIFNHDVFGKVRTLVVDNEPWFVAKDVCDALGVGNTSQALSRLEADERNTIILNEGSGNPEKSIVNEYGLYALVLSSRKKEAKDFKRWITHEVIPAIRKHGGYLTPQKIEEVLFNPDTIIELATRLKSETAKRVEAENKLEEAKPKIVFADAVSASDATILVGDLAKLIKQNGYDIGQKRLFAWLRDNGYLIKRQGADYNSPTQYAMELGLFKIKETAITHADGHVTVSKTTKVTGKGQAYFVNKLLKSETAFAV